MTLQKAATLSLLVWGLVFPGLGRAQQPEDLFTYGITGSDPHGAYTSAMSHLPVQKLLLDLAAQPRSAGFMDAALQGSGVSRQDLEGLGLVRRQGDDYVLSFTLFTSADVRRVRAVAESSARSLVSAFLARRPEIEVALQKYPVKTVDPKAVAYILLGCFSLDWDGLDLTAEKHYRSAAPEQPDGDRYIPWAEQKSDLTLKGIYWGSHNEDLPNVVFTSFGDHFSLPRYALPDLFWRLPRWATEEGNLPESLKPKLRSALWVSVQITARQIGDMLVALREGGKTKEELAQVASLTPEQAADLLGLLVELEYIGQEGEQYYARIPVLGEQDQAMVMELRHIGRQIAETWLAAHYEQLHNDLAGLTPLRYGVPFADGFTQVWHYIFGEANRQLVEAGLFADPYAENRKYKGFIPAVWHPALSDLR